VIDFLFRPRNSTARLHFALVLLVVLIIPVLAVRAQPFSREAFSAEGYQMSTPSRDGIGKRYMGREISRVMGHQGASWLERSSREQEERTDLMIEELNLQEDDVVADIGAGTGYFTFRISPLVPKGMVIAVDIQQEMLDIIEDRAEDSTDNVVTILGTVANTRLPEASVDLILLVDAYHEFSHPREMGQSMFRALKPGGRFALVEYREEDPTVPIKPLHKMSEVQAKKEMEVLGLQWQETRTSLPQQHLMLFAKPVDKIIRK
jgi:ubiquinone/menaquinone biosynthesis C-methylase UbiE